MLNNQNNWFSSTKLRFQRPKRQWVLCTSTQLTPLLVRAIEPSEQSFYIENVKFFFFPDRILCNDHTLSSTFRFYFSLFFVLFPHDISMPEKRFEIYVKQKECDGNKIESKHYIFFVDAPTHTVVRWIVFCFWSVISIRVENPIRSLSVWCVLRRQRGNRYGAVKRA